MWSGSFVYLYFHTLICTILSLEDQSVNLGRFEDKVVKISFKGHRSVPESWSVNTVSNRRLSKNREGRIYIGSEPALFRLLNPGLHCNSSSETISLHLFGHPQVFVRERPDRGVYLDRRNESLEFNMSASFKVLKSNYSQYWHFSSSIHAEEMITVDNSHLLFMSRNGNRFQIDFSSDKVEDDSGFTLRRWFVPTGSSPETQLTSPSNDTIKIANILPFTLKTAPATFYRIQGYWRPYFNGVYTFSLTCDVLCRLIVEQDNRTVRICGSTKICKPVFLHGEPTYAYYYVELMVFSENLTGTVHIDVEKDMEIVKFAQFKKIERTKESHRWSFSRPCNVSCWDELQLSSLERKNEEDKLIANHLILNRELFIPGHGAGFSVGFWFTKRDNLSRDAKKEILSYGSDFRVWFNSTFTDPAVANFTYFIFDLRGKRYVISTSHEVVHVVFTYSHTSESRCYINGKYVKWVSYPVIASSVNPSSSHHISLSANHHISLSSSHHISLSANHHISLSANHHISLSSNHHISPSSNHHISPSSNHHISPSSNHHIGPSSNHHISLSSNHHISPSSNHHISPSSNHHISLSSNHHISPSSNHHISPSSNHHISPSSSHHIGPSSNDSVRPSNHSVSLSIHSVSLSSIHSVSSSIPSVSHFNHSVSPSSNHSASLSFNHSVSPSSNYSAIPFNHSASPSNHSAIPFNHSASPSNHSASPSSNHSASPSNHSAIPSNHSVSPSNHSAIPSNHSVSPSFNYSASLSFNHSVSPSSNHSPSVSFNYSVSFSSNYSAIPSNHSASLSFNHSISPSSNHSASPSNHSVNLSSNHTVKSPVDHFFPQMEKMLSVAIPVNKYFILTELIFWSSEMTSELVLEEYHVSCNVYLSTCRWRNARQYPNQWRFMTTLTPSYPFTGPRDIAGYYFYIDGSSMDYNASAISFSPKVVSAYRCLRFQYFMYGMGIGRLSVYVEHERHSDILWSLAGPQQEKTSKWKNAIVSLPIVEKTAWRKISFHAVRGENFRSDIAISDVKLQAESCQTSPENARPGWKNASSCPNPCPSGIPCIKSARDNESCVCDTRLANFVNQFCLDEMKNSIYRDALYYWSMDDGLTNNSEKTVQQNLVSGVANKAIKLGTEWSQNISTLNDFSVTMWMKITRPMTVFKISRLFVTYNKTSGLLEIFIAAAHKDNITCSHRIQYKWPWDIFVHLAIVGKQESSVISLYKNGELQRQYSSGFWCCDCGIDENLQLFPGNTYDDVSIWSSLLSQSNISGIYNRYGWYKTIEGNYKKQPIIFKINGFWTESVKNATNKDNVLNENDQRKLYDTLNGNGLWLYVSDITVSTDINLTAGITVFMSSTNFWRQRRMKSNLLEQNRFVDVIMDYNVTSKYVSDKPPSNLKVQGITALSVNLSWEFTIEEKLSPFLGFLVVYYQMSSLFSKFLETTANEANLVGLHPYTKYDIYVIPQHLVGMGFISKSIAVTTNESIPTKPPNRLQVTPLSSSSLQINWKSVPKKGRNGNITGYNISISDETDAPPEYIMVSSGSTFSYEKKLLKTYHFYSVKIAAMTVVGLGPWSEATRTRTKPDVPPAPQNVTVQPVSSTVVLIQWSRPPDGPDSGYSGSILGYTVVMLDLVTEITYEFMNITVTNFTRNELNKYNNYSVKVAAFTTVGQGRFSPWIQTRTLEDVPSAAPENLTVSEIANSSLLVVWALIPQADRNGVILGYDLIFLDKLINRSETVRINGSDQLRFLKKSLKKYYYYLITIAGRTSIGVSREASGVQISNLGKVPPPPAKNISVIATSSTSLRMTWSIVMLQHFLNVLQNYSIHLKDVTDNTTKRFRPPFNQTQFVHQANGLKKYHNYSIRLAVQSKGGMSEFSPWIEVKTLSDIPCVKPDHINVSLSLSSLTYELTWPPLNSNSEWCGEPRGYRISYGLRNTFKINFTTATVSQSTNRFLLPKNLTRFVVYAIHVAAFTTVGAGPNVSTAIYINGVPTSAPVLSVETINSTSLKAQWSPISSKNGKADIYIIRARCLGCRENRTFKIPAHRSCQVILNGLRIYRNYSVQIAASNEFGQGNFSNSVFVATDETVPKVAPENVTAVSAAPNNLTVYWSALLNTWGEIRYYRVLFYQNTSLLHNMTTQNSHLAFTGLKKDTEYIFRVLASTSKGEGPVSLNSSRRTLRGAAEFCPSNVSLFNVTAREVQIKWKPLNSDLVPGGLTSYDIRHRIHHVGFPRDKNVKNTRSDQPYFLLKGLEESVTHFISVTAHFGGPTGILQAPNCIEYNVTTEDDAPDAPPRGLYEDSVTSTTMTITWESIPQTRLNGILLGYRINYTESRRSPNSRVKKDVGVGKNRVSSVTVGPNLNSHTFKNLTKFARYSIVIAGYNAYGVGPYSRDLEILTLEDKPSRGPTNVRFVNHASSTSLRVFWDHVPQKYVHGILTGYTLKFKAIEQGLGMKIDDRDIRTESVPPDVDTFEFRNLSSFTRYEVSITARTVKGSGSQASKPAFGETCRCHANISTNWWKIRPYIGVTEDSELTGIFPILVRNMVTSCCQSCSSHTTNIDFRAGNNPKRSIEDMRRVVGENDLSFPVYGSSDQEKYGSLYGFAPVILSPGEAYVIHREPKKSSTDILLALVLSCWPIIILNLVFSLLAGIVIWLLEFRSDSFPRSFLFGVYHGIWWAFITGSTVGYGDRRPVTLCGRIFAVIWALTGQIIMLILTSLVAGSLTTYSMKIDGSLYGKQIAVIQNSSQYNFAVRRNAKVDKKVCNNVEDMVAALKEKEVDGLLIDTYVAGARKELFSEYFRIRRIFDHKSAYGLVMARDAMKLQKCFKKFISENRHMVYEEIRKVVEAIEEPKVSESVSRSTKLIDPTSTHTNKSIIYSVVALVILAVASLLYEAKRRRKKKRKVEPLNAMRILCEDTDREIKQLAGKLERLCSTIQRKHKRELLTLNKMKNSYLAKHAQRSWTELTYLGKNRVYVESVEQ